MYLTAEETGAVLGISTRWVRERIDAGDSLISRHLKCRRDTAPPKKTDRSPVRIASADLARYIVANTREHGWSQFPKRSLDPAVVEAIEQRIWRYLEWHRRQPASVTKPSLRNKPELTRKVG